MAGGDCTNGGVAEELRTCPLSEARGSIPSTARHVSLRRGDAAAIETFSFAEVSSESGTNRSPLVLAYGGREYPLGSRWQNLPIELCRLLDVRRPNLLKRLVAAKSIRNLSLDGTELRRGQLIEGLGVWFEKNLSARDFIHQARKLLDAFGVDPAQVVLVVRRGAVAARARDTAEPVKIVDEKTVSPSGEAERFAMPSGEAVNVPGDAMSAIGASAPVSSDEGVHRLRYDEWRSRDNAVTGKAPVALVVGGERHGVSKWKDVLVATCEVLSRLDRELLRSVVEGMGSKRASLFDSGDFTSPYHHERSDVWLELTQSAESIVRFSRRLFVGCGIYPNTIELLYRDKATVPTIRGHIASGSADEVGRRQGMALVGETPLEQGAVSGTLNGNVATQLAQGDALPTGERIGAYAKREIYAVLAEGRVPDDDFARLQTLEGTKEILGGALSGCPLFSCKEKLPTFGHKKFWHAPVHRNGISVYVNSQWFEYHRPRLEKLLSRWRKADATAAPLAMSAVTDAQRANLGELLEAEFTNGFRLNDGIDGNKMRNFYYQKFREGLPEDLDLASVLPQIGIPLVDVNGKVKVYPWPSNKDGGWRKIVDDLVARGNDVFQFSCLMNRHGNEFMQIGVDPPELLHEVVLREAADAYEIKGGFLLRKGIGDVADYVSKCLVSDDSVIIELKSVAKRLPYVEESYVKGLLKKDRRRFISNAKAKGAKAKGEYVVLEKIEFDNAEVEGGRKLCESCVKKDGHFSLEELVLDDSADMNDSRLSELALRKAFYHRFLEDRFSVKNDRVQMRTHEKRAK